MATTRGARAGTTIKLRARFRDDLGDVAEPTNVFVHIFEPETTDFSLSNALVVSGNPTFLDEGIVEYPYTIPSNGPDGIWYDQWEGELTGQDLFSRFTFEVSASGVIEPLHSQLFDNNVVQVSVASGIRAADGTTLSSEYSFDFMTTTNPAYTNIRKIRLEVGGFVKNLADDVIQTGILEASLEADVITFARTNIITTVYQHARREYVTCYAAQGLLGNIASGNLRSKTLGDLHVEYDTAAMGETLGRLANCVARWEAQVISGGTAKASAQPIGVVKGEFDPDRPIFSRMWQSVGTDEVSRRLPAANDRSRPQGRRRYLRTYVPRVKRW